MKFNMPIHHYGQSFWQLTYRSVSLLTSDPNSLTELALDGPHFVSSDATTSVTKQSTLSEKSTALRSRQFCGQFSGSINSLLRYT